ncbi:MAG: AAA family ATPase [Hahellaceae bacterium]|nr:AAA family ATPase [Hahellaceae bacterium]MCP5211351.1 AAA family ATPase [Hahellaceae bacterium]
MTPLPSHKLFLKCKAADFPFTSTKTLEPLEEIVGQLRAQEAVRFAMAMPASGYNIYAVGRNGLGKRTMMLRYLNSNAGNSEDASDWCYVNSFEDTRAPKVMRLPPGVGHQLKQDMEKLMSRLMKGLPQAFDNDAYYERSEQLKSELGLKQEKSLAQLATQAKKKRISLTITTPGGYRLVALNGDEPHSIESFAALTQEEQDGFEEIINKFEKKLRAVLRKLASWEQEYTDKQTQLNEEVTLAVISHQIEGLQKKYQQHEAVVKFLEEVQKDIVENVDIFLEDNDEQTAIAFAALDKKMPRRYQVNVLVNRKDKQAPIIVEDNPTYHNLFGYVESVTFKGTVFTDFSLIRGGSLHKANGGYLLMDAIKVLEQPFVWDGLKRALRSKTLGINSLERELTLSGTISLEPEPIPLKLKIILFGDRETYLLLQQYDPEFMELFKVAADFEGEMPRNVDTQLKYAKFITSLVHEKSLMHCDRTAVMRIIEHSSRVAEDQTKLSLHAANIANLLREADYWAGQSGSKLIRQEHIRKALDSADHRTGRVRDMLLESIANGTTLLSVTGKRTGQVNALSVLYTGDSEFGTVSRVTSTARYGDGDVIDIERDVKLGGNIHTKGVLILSSYLASMFGFKDPMRMSASITFEQSYGEVDGDSASVAEFCSLLSSLSAIPVNQELAITGSMNQKGEVQPIGGVNEKVEGFYEACKMLGLTGTQGVIVPATNVHNLMLKEEVVEACAQGKFHIYAVSKVSDAVQLLLGKPMGVMSKKGDYPAGSVLGAIQKVMADIRQHEQKLDHAHGGLHSKSETRH